MHKFGGNYNKKPAGSKAIIPAGPGRGSADRLASLLVAARNSLFLFGF